MKKLVIFNLVILMVLSVFCTKKIDPEQAGKDMLSENNLREHIKFLSHDLLEGRDTGSRGEKIAGEYMAAQFAMNGVKPAGDNGTFFQNFQMVTHKTEQIKNFSIIKNGKQLSLKNGTDFTAYAENQEPVLSINRDIVFAGYGIAAPEYGWDDYKDTDVAGKIVVVLSGEPVSEDEAFFKGEKPTDYSLWSSKLFIAEEKNADGIIIIYDKDIIGYPWNAIAGFFSRPRMNLKVEDTARSGLFCFITPECSEKLFEFAGLSAESEKENAEKKEFKPKNLNMNLSAEIKSSSENLDCRNVIGLLPGKKEDEYIIYTAHTDHLGIGAPDETGDNIYNGALDDASGCAALIELSRVFNNLPDKPERSIVFLGVTAEEKGLFGSKYYTKNPVFPLNKTLADINLDTFLPWGKTKDFIFLGEDRSSLGDLAREIAEDNGMILSPDPMPEQGFYTRSDHYSFAQAGVPGGFIINGFLYEDKPDEWGLKEFKKWLQEVYHHPHEEYSDEWKMETITQMVRIGFQFGYRIAENPVWPAWNEDQPFKKIREKSLQTEN